MQREFPNLERTLSRGLRQLAELVDRALSRTERKLPAKIKRQPEVAGKSA